ncbi:RNA-directed DNA polymerase [Patescibacteria group bacterium]|nr:MAG: RNA-directed DNA polymerase [Patescibacteria group bacterium]
MNLMFDDIVDVVDKKFWGIINDLRVHESKTLRLPALTKLSQDLKSLKYFPSLPHSVKESDKGLGVARQIPIFNLNDYSVYYYCVRRIEYVISKNRVPGTYGGWSMGGKIRKMEEGDGPEDEYSMTYSYNPAAWSKYYGDFNAKLYAKILELRDQGKGNYLVFELDIANFYDNIQLDILEKKIRQDADYKESGVLDLLMYFLSHSNRLVNRYQTRTVGIPQDAFGDCSRLLSNYYLQDYDLFMSNVAERYDATYLRYADDQVLFVPDDQAGRDLLQIASRRLARLGLNINQKKVELRTLDELYTYRSFDIFDLFVTDGAKDNKDKVNEFAKLSYATIDRNADNIKGQGYPLIKRLISANFNLLTPARRTRFIAYIFDDSFMLSCNYYTMKTVYSRMRDEEKLDFLSSLETLVLNRKHSSFHYEVLAFYRSQGMDTSTVESRISDLRKEIYEIV